MNDYPSYDGKPMDDLLFAEAAIQTAAKPGYISHQRGTIIQMGLDRLGKPAEVDTGVAEGDILGQRRVEIYETLITMRAEMMAGYGIQNSTGLSHRVTAGSMPTVFRTAASANVANGTAADQAQIDGKEKAFYQPLRDAIEATLVEMQTRN